MKKDLLRILNEFDTRMITEQEAIEQIILLKHQKPKSNKLLLRVRQSKREVCVDCEDNFDNRKDICPACGRQV